MNFVIESTPNKIEIDYDLISQIENKLEENISFNKEGILDVKWISKKELINMTDKELRDEKRIKRTLKMLEENKVYPLNSIKIFKGLKIP